MIVNGWAPVVGWEQTYEVSIEGVVRRISAAKNGKIGHILKPWRQPSGYWELTLSGPRCTVALHQIVQGKSWVHV